MAGVEMMSTTKNPLRNTKEPRRSIKTTFNVNDIIEDWTKTDGGVLSEEKQKVIKNLKKLDKDGDGEIDLKEILLLESELESEKAQAGRMRKALCAVVLLVIMLLGMMLAMGVAAVEFTKETRVRGGAPVAKSSQGTVVDTTSSSRRRLGMSEKDKAEKQKELQKLEKDT